VEEAIQMFERVLVSNDGGDVGAAAVEWAIHRSAWLPSKLRLTDGIPSDEVMTSSEDWDLLVVGTEGRETPGAAHNALSMRIAGLAHCATAMVQVGWARSGHGVVVGWDDDNAADTVLAVGAIEAQWRDCPLTVVHVVKGFSKSPEAEERRPPALSSAVDRLRTEFPHVVMRIQVRRGSVSEELVEAADDSALLVIGAGRGRTHPTLGRVSHDVVQNASTPVIVVPPEVGAHYALRGA
jgi:nucleotide-binding universal stress UspA family protein